MLYTFPFVFDLITKEKTKKLIVQTEAILLFVYILHHTDSSINSDQYYVFESQIDNLTVSLLKMT